MPKDKDGSRFLIRNKADKVNGGASLNYEQHKTVNWALYTQKNIFQTGK
jgi:hypothetical protein